MLTEFPGLMTSVHYFFVIKIGMRLLCSKFHLLFFPKFPKNLPNNLLIITYHCHEILLTILRMQVILELNDCSIKVYRSFGRACAHPIIYSSSFCHNYLMHALISHCYQFASWTVFETSCLKRPKILKLCLGVSYS